MAVIELTALSKRFGTVRAVDDLSFAIEAGRVTGFLGPNGAGKTTTLRMLLGLVRPTSGQARLWGKRYADLGSRRRQVGAVLEATGLHPGRTVHNHLRVRCAAAGVPQSRADAVLGLVGMADLAGRRAGGLSLGERQRLGLASAMVADPEVLILDEPGNGLDPDGVRWLRSFLRGLGGEGRTVLVSSHVLAEVAQTADDLVIMQGGQLVSQATVEDLAGAARDSDRLEDVFLRLTHGSSG